MTQIQTENGENTADIKVEHITKFKGADLEDLCDAAEATITDSDGFTIGFHRDGVPSREQMENYWKGILLIPDRKLVVGRLDGTIAASIQLVKPLASNHAASFAATLDSHFVAPWARGYGLAKMLIKEAEDIARAEHISVIKLSVRANHKPAVNLYENMGFKRWGTLDKYEYINGIMYAGHFYAVDQNFTEKKYQF